MTNETQERRDTFKENPTDKKLPSKTERTWAMLCHVSIFLGMIIPFGNILAPLVIWLIKKDEMSFVKDQGIQVLNFQISMIIYLILSIFLIILLIGIPIVFCLFIINFISTIIGAIQSNDGKFYRYSMSIQFIK